MHTGDFDVPVHPLKFHNCCFLIEISEQDVFKIIFKNVREKLIGITVKCYTTTTSVYNIINKSKIILEIYIEFKENY